MLAVLWFNRGTLSLPVAPAAGAKPGAAGAAGAAAVGGSFDFLRIPAVWMCFGFFFVYAIVISVVQAFAPEAARQLNGVPLALAAMCLTVYMVCSAGGMVLGGFLAADPSRCERIVGVGFGMAAVVALTMALVRLPVAAVPVMFGIMGFASGIAGPSRDLLVKKSTPENATGRVYGVVYAGLDIGQAISPLIFGVFMDRGWYAATLAGAALVLLLSVGAALGVGRRTVAA